MSDVIECTYCGGQAKLMGDVKNTSYFRCSSCKLDTVKFTDVYGFDLYHRAEKENGCPFDPLEDIVDIFWKPEDYRRRGRRQ